jgi:hypothetical protein
VSNRNTHFEGIYAKVINVKEKKLQKVIGDWIGLLEDLEAREDCLIKGIYVIRLIK